MAFSLNGFLSSLFGNKATRDMKEIKPVVQKVLNVYPEIQKLSNDELRAKTDEIKVYLQGLVTEQRAKIEALNAKIKETEIDQRQPIFDEIDKIDAEILDIFEKGLNEVLPTVFAIVKDTARRFTENEDVVVTATEFDKELSMTHDFVDIDGDKAIWHNHWVAGGNDTVWNMIHYDVQLFGGVVLHQGKIAEMATGEGKTLVATLPVFLNALTRNGVHVVTVNDYLAKRDSEWMGPLYMFHGLSVDCIDKHQPNSDARRKAYQADITFGTNNEFGFDYLRDNMAMRPEELVQRSHNFAIVDEVDCMTSIALLLRNWLRLSVSWQQNIWQPHVSKSTARTRRKLKLDSLHCSVHISPCQRTRLSSSSFRKTASRQVSSRRRKSTWRTTTAGCLRLRNHCTSWWMRS